MKIKLTNTLSNKLEIFQPQHSSQIKIYVCGPTVYDHPHIGNARALVVYDLLFRLLQSIYKNYEIIYVRNITDIDDKIINKARADGVEVSELTSRIIASFEGSCKYLHCLSPTFEPKASDYIHKMCDIIQILIDKGHAYQSSDHVYFAVESYKNYGALANREIAKGKQGARVDVSKAKHSAEDFVLWKPSTDGEIGFNSKWGKGRPGWHIECSAMSYEFLGADFDIHGGGADLMFPHHTNEIAQSCCAFPGSTYATTWVHNGFVTVEGEKMSKSLGNFITINDIMNMKIDGEVLRILLLSVNYRSPLDYNKKLLQDTLGTLQYLYRALRGFNNITELAFTDLPEEFTNPILDDLNTPLALSYMIKLAGQINKTQMLEEANILFSCGRFLGIFNKAPESWLQGEEEVELIEDLIQQRAQAKNEKKWDIADLIRSKLLNMGIILEDRKDGITLWSRKL